MKHAKVWGILAVSISMLTLTGVLHIFGFTWPIAIGMTVIFGLAIALMYEDPSIRPQLDQYKKK